MQRPTPGDGGQTINNTEMNGLIEQNVTFKDGEYYTSFDFEQWVREARNQIRMVLTDFDGGVKESAECDLCLDEWEYLAKRIIEMVAYQKQLNNKTRL